MSRAHFGSIFPIVMQPLNARLDVADAVADAVADLVSDRCQTR
jgi:hypothetical protein